MLKYLKKISEINILSFLNISLFFLIPYIFYYTYSIKEIYSFILMLFLLIFSFFVMFHKNDIYFSLNNYSIIIFIFIISIIISGFTNSEKNILILQERFWVWLSITFFIIFFIAIQKPDIKKIIDFLIYFSFFIVVIGLFQYLSFLNYLSVPFINANTFNFRIYSVFGNPDNYAIYLVVVLPFLIYKYAENKKVYYLFFLLLSIISLLLTKSLSGIISVLFQLILFFLFFYKSFLNELNIKYKRIILLLFLLIVFVLLIIGFNFLNKKADSVNIRKFLWESTILMIKDYAMSGTGAGNFRIFTPYYQGILYKKKQLPDYIEVHDEAYTHNDYLQIFSEQGIPGFLIFLLLLLYPVYIFIKSDNKRIYLPFLISLSGILIFALFNFPFFNPFIIAFYILSGFILCAENNKLTIKIGSWLRFIILLIAFIMAFSNIKFVKNFYERYYLTQFFSYQLARSNYDGLYNYILKSKKIIKNDYQLNFYSGAILNALKKYEEAKIYFKQAIKLFPYFSSAYYNLGNALFNNGELDDAIKIYEKLLNFNPTYKSAYNNLGTIYIQKGEIDKAIETLEAGLKFDKDSKYLNYNLALCYNLKQNYDKSLNILKEILKNNPDFYQARELYDRLLRVKN